jgi:glycosyltransferase involved in cell wall biosynthesis
MTTPLISVVIPTFNYGRFIEEAVESVLAQTYTNFEIIVVDDGSVDDTRERLERFGGSIQYIHQTNQGMSAARNVGIERARGDLIAFLDSDDVWHPRKLEIQVPILQARPDIGLLATHLEYGAGGSWQLQDVPASLPIRQISLEELVIGSRFGTCGVLVRKHCFEVVGTFDAQLRAAEDVEMWIRIASRFIIGKIEIPLWRYRLHGDSTHRNLALMDVNIEKKLDRIFAGPQPLSRSVSLRRRAGSVAAFFAAYGYLNDGRWDDALSRSLQSVRLWPLGLPKEVTGSPVAHHRLLLRLLVMKLGWRPRQVESE